jgi:hypothetical protein
MRPALALVLLVLGAGGESAAAAEDGDRHAFTGAVDLSWVRADTDLVSWLEHGSGKLRFDEEHDGFAFSRAFVDYRGRMTGTLNAKLTVNVNDAISHAVDLTEAFVEWRPMPRSAWHVRGRAGAFYPKISLENTDAGWSSAYGLSSSVINTWIGEELRAAGAELRVTRDFAQWPAQHLSLEGGMFYGNDPTGALLAWRGWSSHDRQTGLTSSLPTPAVSAIAPWDEEGRPIPDYEPFREIDHDPGFYVGGEWQWGARARIKAFHYDNHADPEAETAAGEYAWQTWFDHVGAEFELPWHTALIGQWISGSTRMGPDLGPWRMQDIDFDSTFLLLTRASGRHRLSLRYEWFDLQPFNDPAGITNQDDGNALAASWLYQLSDQFRVGAEYLSIASDHCATTSCVWVGSGLPRTTREQSFQLTVRWRFDAHL